jgi:hypothetical protein
MTRDPDRGSAEAFVAVFRYAGSDTCISAANQ